MRRSRAGCVERGGVQLEHERRTRSAEHLRCADKRPRLFASISSLIASTRAIPYRRTKSSIVTSRRFRETLRRCRRTRTGPPGWSRGCTGRWRPRGCCDPGSADGGADGVTVATRLSSRLSSSGPYSRPLVSKAYTRPGRLTQREGRSPRRVDSSGSTPERHVAPVHVTTEVGHRAYVRWRAGSMTRSPV